MKWAFPSGARVQFQGIELEKDLENFKGSQVPLIIFDELTGFTERMFNYLLSRNRSSTGVRPYIRATCNPVSEGWVRKLVDWWIDENGYPIEARCGVVRWFIRRGEDTHWYDTKDEAEAIWGADAMPKSFTFINATVKDNKKIDPSYEANLKALSRVEREALYLGNWNTKANAGSYFQSDWCEYVEPKDVPVAKSEMRAWDTASTEPSEVNPDPDYTAGVKIRLGEDGYFYLRSVKRGRKRPQGVKKMMLSSARSDGIKCVIGIPLDPGGAGKSVYEDHAKNLAGFKFKKCKTSKSKLERFEPFSSAAEAGLVKIVRGDWNDDYIRELENFTGDGKGHDDQVDGTSDAFNNLATGKKVSTDIVMDLEDMYSESIWNI
jgi:predicted phage terminase large subunit-like protein